MNLRELNEGLRGAISVLTESKVKGAEWKKMLRDLKAGKPGHWSFDGRALSDLEAWIRKQGGKEIGPSSRFSEGPQINYSLPSGISIEAVEGNFLGPFTQVQAEKGKWRGTPYMGD